MKIVLCLNHFMPAKLAGTEVYTGALAKLLQKNGQEVTIVIPNYDTTKDDEYKYDGLTVMRYGEPNVPDRNVINGNCPPQGIDAFQQLVRRIAPDIVHVQELAGSSGIGIHHLRVLKALGIKVVFTMHLSRYSCFTGSMMYKGKDYCNGTIDIRRCTECALSRTIKNNSRQVFFHLSMLLHTFNINTSSFNNPVGTAFSYPYSIEKLKNELSEVASLCENIIVLADWYKEVLIRNGISEYKLKLLRQALPYPVIDYCESQQSTIGKALRLVYIGRIDPSKGLHLLLEAVENLPEDEIIVDVFGGINDTEYYHYWKEKTVNKGNIEWKGLVEQKDVVETIKRYNAIVLPSSTSEMSPLVIQEAFAARVPVIGANISGISEHIKHLKNGLLFNFKSSVSLKENLMLLLDNRGLIEELKSTITPPASFDTVLEEMLVIYEDALKESSVEVDV